MFFLVLKSIIVFFVGISFSFASEKASEAPKEGAHETSKEGVGASETPQIKSSEESFNAIQARVAALEAKVRSGEMEIGKLIVEKQHTNDPEKVSEIIRQMISVHREIERNAKEYDQQRALLRYRYPDKGITEKREYERIEVKSIEEMEHQLSLSSSLERTLKKVRSQYQSEIEIDHKKRTKERPSLNHEREATSKSKSNLADPIILKK